MPPLLSRLAICTSFCAALGCERPTPARPQPEETQEVASPKAPASPIELYVEGERARPLLVVLHGYGANEADLLELGQVAVQQGYAALLVPAPEVLRERGYSWPKGQPEKTHVYLQGLIQASMRGRSVTRSPVWLAGFSQGALHGSWLVARHPEHYAGVLAISPGGWTDPPQEVREPKRPRHMALIGGTSEKPKYRARQVALAKLWASAGWPIERIEHQGGHHFHRAWKADVARILKGWAPRP